MRIQIEAITNGRKATIFVEACISYLTDFLFVHEVSKRVNNFGGVEIRFRVVPS